MKRLGWWLFYPFCAFLLVPLALILFAQQTHAPTSEVYDFLNGMQVAGAWRSQPMPPVETITAGATITADACGTGKRITAAGAVTTGTVNTFTAPSPPLGSCTMILCNVGPTNTITLDKNALFLTQGGIDLPLPANSCVTVGSDGTIWRQQTAVQTST